MWWSPARSQIMIFMLSTISTWTDYTTVIWVSQWPKHIESLLSFSFFRPMYTFPPSNGKFGFCFLYSFNFCFYDVVCCKIFQGWKSFLQWFHKEYLVFIGNISEWRYAIVCNFVFFSGLIFLFAELVNYLYYTERYIILRDLTGKTRILT